MSRHEIHPSDTELLMSLDGELLKRRAAEVENHIRSCWMCRERRRSVEENITSYVRARKQDFGDRVPSAAGPRALLRARLETARKQDIRPVERAHAMFWSIVAAGACCCVLAAGLVVFSRTLSANSPRPNSRVTPGETRPIALTEVCRMQEAEVVRNISAETRSKVLAAYGIAPESRADFEVDYLITPDLGGADSLRNLWPQPYSVRWNAKVKDRLEQRLHDLVCAGKLDLSTAQREIASDWIGAYKKYIGSGNVMF